MRKREIFGIGMALIATACDLIFPKQPKNIMTKEIPESAKSIHTFIVKDIEGKEFSFIHLKGKKVMIVNTASKCGLTPQYENLEKLYQKYKENNFIVIGFPANNFMNQEPGNNEEIAVFCKSKYGVTFPMMQKVSVRGKDIHELFKFLTSKEKNGVLDAKISWNFHKFLIDKNGFVIASIGSKILPDNSEIIKWIEK